MTSPTNPDRPTVAEVAALTARLRSISERGRDVSADERAAFLADKDALIDRITDTGADAGGVDAVGSGSEQAQRLQEQPWTAQGRTVDRATWVVMPESEFTAPREQIAERDSDRSGARRVNDRLATAVPWFADMEAEQDERREQLTRWHADDATQDTDTNDDGRGLDEGLYVTDDAPGLP